MPLRCRNLNKACIDAGTAFENLVLSSHPAIADLSPVILSEAEGFPYSAFAVWS